MKSNPPSSTTPSQPSEDEKAARFAYLMMEHKDALYRYLLSLHPWTNEIDDLLQDTAMTLWKKIDDYDWARDFLPWALRFAYFEVLRWRKHMRKRRFVLSEKLVEQLSTTLGEQRELDELRHAALQDCLQKLGKEQREIVLQRYGGSGTLKELANRVGTSIHKIYHDLDRARSSLAQCVQKKLSSQDDFLKGGSGR